MPAGSALVRVSSDALGSTEPSTSNAARRFNPVRTPNGHVPVLYAGQDLCCAPGETVFHDLADDASVQQEVLRSNLLTFRTSTMSITRDVVLADLRDPALTAHGLHREQVITTDPTEYPTTRL